VLILDSRLKIPLQSKVLHLDSIAKTLIFCSPSADRRQIDLLARIDGVEVKVVQGNTEGRGLNLQEVLEHLGKCGVCSVLVEGGAAIHGAFLKESLVDRVMLFVAPLFAGEAGTPLINGFSVNDNKSAPVLKMFCIKNMGKTCWFRAISSRCKKKNTAILIAGMLLFCNTSYLRDLFFHFQKIFKLYGKSYGICLKREAMSDCTVMW